MRTLILAATLASTAMLALPASAVEVCDKTCVGPACAKSCVHEPSATVGRRDRDTVIIEERTRRSREPAVEIRKERRPGVEVDVR
jgi:hypothetical protein